MEKTLKSVIGCHDKFGLSEQITSEVTANKFSGQHFPNTSQMTTIEHKS